MSSHLIRHEIYDKLISGILEAGVMRLAIGRASKAELNALSKFRVVCTDDVNAFADYNEAMQSRTVSAAVRSSAKHT